MTNTYELLARERKAARLADLCQRCDINSELAREASVDDQRLAAKYANVKPPSAATWALVVEMLERREKAQKEVA